MSKIGKKNISIPKESSIKIEGGVLTISGPKGSKKLTINDKIFSSKVNLMISTESGKTIRADYAGMVIYV